MVFFFENVKTSNAIPSKCMTLSADLKASNGQAGLVMEVKQVFGTGYWRADYVWKLQTN